MYRQTPNLRSLLKGITTMTTERKRMTLGSRSPNKQRQNQLLSSHESGNTTVRVALGPSIEDQLTELLSHQEREGDAPAARLKSTDATFNASGERVILIRRNPFAEKSEYEPAATAAGAKALKQWVNAGLSELYPNDHRVFSERDLIRTVNEAARQDKNESRNAWSRYTDANTTFIEEIVHVFDEQSRVYRKAQWTITNKAREVNMLHEAAAMNRLAHITYLIKDQYIITPDGIKSARAAQMLALIDSLPINQTRWVDADLRIELA
ncbi:hypothetical protein, partial [Marinobacter sp. ELB17]|uniref:hypothetical protein n=1 Tax=Marinobacter sp. ELB17 TaxID=270374 RepID=UPI0012F48C9A